MSNASRLLDSAPGLKSELSALTKEGGAALEKINLTTAGATTKQLSALFRKLGPAAEDGIGLIRSAEAGVAKNLSRAAKESAAAIKAAGNAASKAARAASRFLSKVKV